MLRLNKDLAHLLFKDLSLKDLENLYKAGGITKQFVEKNFLKDGCSIKFKVKDENIHYYNNLLNLLEDTSCIIFRPNSILFSNKNRKIEINLKNDFFQEYFCSISLNVLDFSIPSMQSSDILKMEILEYSVSIENTNRLNISKENGDWSFVNEKHLNIRDRNIKRIGFPISSDVNIIIDKNIMNSFIEIINSPNKTLFSVSDKILEIKRNGKSIKRKLTSVELDKNFKLEVSINKIHALQFIKTEIEFMLSESFLMIQIINNKYELKILAGSLNPCDSQSYPDPRGPKGIPGPKGF